MYSYLPWLPLRVRNRARIKAMPARVQKSDSPASLDARQLPPSSSTSGKNFPPKGGAARPLRRGDSLAATCHRPISFHFLAPQMLFFTSERTTPESVVTDKVPLLLKRLRNVPKCLWLVKISFLLKADQ